MIVSRLMGGLGNQLFQYAVGRALAERHQTSLKLDLSILLDRRPRANFTLRSYELGVFNIQESFVAADELTHDVRFYETRLKRWLGRLSPGLSPGLRPWNLVTEKQHHFDPHVLQAPDRSYLVGYWQTERYFESIEPILRNELTLKAPLSDEAATIANTIRSTINSVCVHVRRGDFVDNPAANRLHGLCDPQYYTEGASLLCTRLGAPHFFVFSDDLPWCRQHLTLGPLKTFVDLPGSANKTSEHLKLMSLCQHSLISNSSFAWWAVWLGNQRSALVVSPKRWFKDSRLSTIDLIPRQWLTI